MLQNNSDSVLLIAGGIGYSYVYSILVNVLTLDVDKEILMFWGMQKKHLFYDLKKIRNLIFDRQDFKLDLITEKNSHGLQKYGNLITSILHSRLSFVYCNVYVAGSSNMVRLAASLLCKLRHAQRSKILSDAL